MNHKLHLLHIPTTSTGGQSASCAAGRPHCACVTITPTTARRPSCVASGDGRQEAILRCQGTWTAGDHLGLPGETDGLRPSSVARGDTRPAGILRYWARKVQRGRIAPARTHIFLKDALNYNYYSHSLRSDFHFLLHSEQSRFLLR